MQRDSYQAIPDFHLSEAIVKNHAKKRLQCLIIGNFGAYNIADEAILAGELTELSKIPNLKITVAAENPAEVKRLHGSIHVVPVTSLNKEIKKADFIVIGGGSFFKQKNIKLLLLLLWKQRLFRKKIYIPSLGLASKNNLAVNLFMYSLISKSTLVNVQDQTTADLLKNRNIHASIFKDQSYFMEPAPISTVLQDPYFKRFYRKDRVNIGLSFKKPHSKKEEKHLISELTTFVAKNYNNTDFWFYATDHHPKHFNDEKFGHVLHETFKKKIGKDVQFHFVPTTWNPQKYLASTKLMSFIISMCPYTALFGYRNKTNIVCVTESKEKPGLFSYLGKDIFKINDLTAKKLQIRLSQ